MCMSSVSFALEYDKGCREFVGYGYKKIKNANLSKYRNWSEATGDWYGAKTLKTAIESADDMKSYIPGFHIFLHKGDAENYQMVGPSTIVKVKYKGVLSFGRNETGPFNEGPCVIASHMKIVEKYNG